MAVWLAWQGGLGEKKNYMKFKNDKKPQPSQPECQKFLMIKKVARYGMMIAEIEMKKMKWIKGCVG